MRWFLRSTRFAYTAPVAVVLGMLSASVVGGSIAIPVIDRSRAFGELPFTALVPLAFVIVIGALAARAAPPVSGGSVRAHAALLASIVIMNAGLYAAAGLLPLTVVAGVNLASSRNVLGYAALLLVGQATLGLSRAPVVPALYVIVATIFGRIDGVIAPWAWPVVPATGPDVALAMLLAAAAAAASACARQFPARFYR